MDKSTFRPILSGVCRFPDTSNEAQQQRLGMMELETFPTYLIQNLFLFRSYHNDTSLSICVVLSFCFVLRQRMQFFLFCRIRLYGEIWDCTD